MGDARCDFGIDVAAEFSGITVLNIPGNALSREVEAAADGYSLSLYGHPDAFVGVERKLALQNVSDPDPPDEWV